MNPRCLVLAAAVLGAPGVLACGVCVEDKVAATYDHAVVMRAAARQQVVVFADVEGPGDAHLAAAAARSAAAHVAGIERGTVRAASAPAALSFALDPRVDTPEGAVRSIERNARAAHLKLTVLRVVR